MESDGIRPDADRKIELRGLSVLQLISDDAFARGLRDFAAYCRSDEADEPVYEPVELFSLRPLIPAAGGRVDRRRHRNALSIRVAMFCMGWE